MSLPRDLWPGAGSWGLGVPPPEVQRPEKKTPTQRRARRNVAPPRATLPRRAMSRLRGKDRRKKEES
jgi:hypothetical protein